MLNDPRLWNTIRCMCIEHERVAVDSQPGQAVVVKTWELEFELAFETFTVDAERQLLVLLRYRPGSTDQEWWYEYVCVRRYYAVRHLI